MTDSDGEPPHSAAPLCAAPDRNPRPPRLAMPSLSCDCHAHVCGPAGTHPFVAERIYTPPDALLPEYLSMLATLGVERCVLVQPSVYGSNNSALLEALARSPMPARGVVCLDKLESEQSLLQMDDLGARGVRLNLVDRRKPGGPLPLQKLRRMGYRVRSVGWHQELLIHVDHYPSLDEQLRHVPGDLVLAHMGYADRDCDVDSAGFQQLLKLLDRGDTWVKLTGPYRVSTQDYPYSDVQSLVDALVARAPERLLWGTDWPHVNYDGKMPNDGDLCDLLLPWLPEPTVRSKVLVDNPEKLYRF